MLTSLAESFAAGFTALAETYARRLGTQTVLAARIDLMRGGLRSTWPFTAISDRLVHGYSTGRFRPSPGARDRTPLPAGGDRDLFAADTARSAVACGLAEDVLHQFGVVRLAFF